MHATISSVNVPAFDLSYVVEQLSHKFEYKSWSPERFVAAEAEYRRFLTLCKMFPNERLIPGRDVDSIWHRHMLNSRRYMQDCEQYFGYYLHHQPHSRIIEDTRDPNVDWLNTLRLYEETFGEKPREGWLNNMAICNGGCDAGGCSPGS